LAPDLSLRFEDLVPDASRGADIRALLAASRISDAKMFAEGYIGEKTDG